jgi:hypothetical protein
MKRLVALAVLSIACGPAQPARCPTAIPPTHLFEGFCTDGPGFCLFDSQTPF